VIMRGAAFSQMVEEERLRLVEQQIEEVEDSEWYRFRVIQIQWYPQTPPVHLWTKDCQLRKSKARRLTLAPIEEEGNLADVMFQKDDTPMQLEEDATQLGREKSRYGSMELMNFILESTRESSSSATTGENEEDKSLGRERLVKNGPPVKKNPQAKNMVLSLGNNSGLWVWIRKGDIHEGVRVYGSGGGG
jgi:hypothetical protein